jgi:hypothetical protein
LLLENLLKKTPIESEEYEQIEAATKKIVGVAEYLNERRRIATNLNKLVTIGSAIKGLTIVFLLVEFNDLESLFGLVTTIFV